MVNHVTTEVEQLVRTKKLHINEQLKVKVLEKRLNFEKLSKTSHVSDTHALRRGYTWIEVIFEVLLKGNCRIKMGWKHYQTADHPK